MALQEKEAFTDGRSGRTLFRWLDQLHHGFVKDWETLEFDHATHHDEKPGSTRKKRGGVVWPSDDALAIALEIGYGHFPDQ